MATGEVDWDAVSKTAPKGEVDWGAVAKQNPTPPKQPGVVQRVVESFKPYVEEWSRASREGGEHFKQAISDFVDPSKVATMDHPQGGFLEAGPVVSAAVDWMGSPMVSPFTAGIGRPVEKATGGRISRDVAGNVASVLVPGLGEAAAERSLAREAAALSRTTGMTREEALTHVRNQRAAAARAPRPEKTVKPPLKNRELVQKNVQAMERLGIEPSTAMAVPGARRAGMLLGQNPFVGSPVRQAMQRTEHGVEAAGRRLATRSGQRFTPEAAGEQVSKGLQRFQETSPETGRGLRGDQSGFKASGEAGEGTPSELTRQASISSARRTPSRFSGFGPKSSALYADAEEKIGPLSGKVVASQTRAALSKALGKYDLAALNSMFGEQTAANLQAILANQRGVLSFDDLRTLRTDFRKAMKNALRDPSVRAPPDEAAIRGIYKAMSEDLQNGARTLGGMYGKARGEAAAKAWRTADNFYRAGMDRIDDSLSKYYGKGTDYADVFHSLLRGAQGGAKQDLRKLLAVKRSLHPEEWEAFTSGVVDRMGRALPGRESAETDFSIQTFLTNYNRLHEQATRDTSGADSGLKVLFEGKYGKETTQVLRDMNIVASQFRELERGKNLSETAAHGLVGGTMLSSAYILHNPFASVIPIIVGNAASLVLGNPRFVRWLASLPKEASAAEVARAKQTAQQWMTTAAATGVAESGRQQQGAP